VAQIKITADASQATREIDRLESSIKGLKDKSADTAKALALITGAAAAMGYAIKQTLDVTGALVDASNRIGISAANLNTLQQAAKLAGVEAETLNMSLLRLSRSIGEGLQKSSSGSAQAMKTLGLPIQEIANLKPDEQFTRITEALAKMENPAQRNAVAFELFGKQAPAILQVANELEKVNRLINESGFVVTQEELIALDQAGESIDQLGILWDAGIKKAVAEIAPYIVGFVIKLKEAIKEAGGFEGIWLKVKSIVHSIFNILTIMATVMATRLVVGTAMLAVQMGRAALAAKSFSLFLSRTPIGLLAAGVAILADKIGIDLVGGLGEANGLQDTYKLGQDAINAALDESNKKLNETGEVIQGITEDQKKLQASFTDAVKNSALDLEYQKDILAVGKDQADINKIINDHKQKHLDAGIDINVEEEKKLRANMAQSQSLQKQNELLTQQKQLIEGYINAQRPGEKLVQDIENLRRTLSGEPIIVPIRIETQDDMTANANKALEVAKRQAGEFADSAVAQYSKLYGEAFQITNDYNKAVRELDDALLAARAAGGEQELARVQAIEEAKLAVRENAQRRTMEMEIAKFENANKLNDLQIDLDAARHAESLRNQKDIFGNAMFNQKQLMEIARERAEFEKKTELEKAQFAIQQGATIFSALGAQNKKAFEAAKAFNIANAIMNTYMGATKALATYPWPFGLVAAAAAVASGLAQVAQIRSQQYSGRALGGPVMGGTPYLVGESGPELFTPATTGTITRNSDLQGGGTTNVNFTIVANDTTGFDQLLASRKGVIQQIISDAMLEKGRRSMV
jgi:hypothetical protein